MNKTLLIVGIIITGISLLTITIFSISNTILKKVNKEKELVKTAEQKKRDKRFKKVLKYSKKIIKKINKVLVENYVALYVVSALTFTGGAVLTTVSAVKVVEENNSSEVEPSSISSSEESSITPSSTESQSTPGSSSESDSSSESSSSIPVNYYTITWKNYDGSLLATTEHVAEGTTPTYTGTVTPYKALTNTISYVFDGWSPTLVPVTSDATYTAKFTETTRLYTVQWLNEDDSLILEDQYEYEILPVFEGTPPTYGPTDQYEYEFYDWDRTILPVTEDTFYKATYITHPRTATYTVTWINFDGTELAVSEVEHGHPAIYDGPTPYRLPEADVYFVFTGWDRDLSTITSDCQITATYNETTTTYSIRMYDPNNVSAGPFVFNNAYEGLPLSYYKDDLEDVLKDAIDSHIKIYSFYYDFDLSELVDTRTIITSNMNLYVTYLYEYRVNYYIGDDIVDYEDVESGDCASGNVSSYSNYTWYYRDNPTEEFDFSTPITSDINLIGENNNNSTNL